MKNVVLAAASILALSSLAFAADIKSGLATGETPPAFHVKDVTGPSAGKSLCYRCKYNGKPTVAVFVRDVDDNLASLVKKLDAQVAKESSGSKLSAFVVVLTDDPETVATKLEKIAKDNGLQNVPLTTMASAGPEEYKIAKNAEVTVLMWNGDVKVNHAYGKGDFDKKAVETCAADTKKILD